MYKLVALDMDGTLLNSQGEISPRTKEAIAQARQQGVHVVLASGRPLEGMTKYLAELDMNSDQDYVLSYNASLVQRVASKEVIRSQILKGSDAKNLASLSQDLGVNVHAFSRRFGLITPQNNEYTRHEAEINGLTITELDFVELDNNEDIMKVMMIDEPERLSAAIAKLPPHVYEQYTVVQSAPFFLEFLNPKSNKGTGVGMLAEHLGIDASEVICMGDAGNDKHMIEYAGLGVAMANATDDIKAIANHITDSNNEHGVAKVIEDFILNR
ncbi:HAD family hydrolase [Photobacterium jeanii]|uniref:HAD family hydrolase n=1 Tax=Photobacterium jeanii TaxID=858640 RepID=A0A178K834_9GAMM|nr:sugar-phosphatase [Photobacterium jeanii]OAN13287.1 HAD family hydrolase [Photobacterium jeanii]PST90286.1 Cof-type HAD-IIB family hydrolase [Photobacterium jeanii]